MEHTQAEYGYPVSMKASALQDQFSSVFTHDNGMCPQISMRPCSSSIDSFHISTKAVCKVLCTSPLKYGPTPDGIPMAILKLLSFELAEPLQLIFAASLATGALPKCWKSGVITPIFKKGDPSNPANYRPVSITASMCWKFEQVFWHFVLWRLHRERFFSDYQWGALQGRSTEL